MPKIPRFQADVRITTQAPTPRLPVSTAGRTGLELANIGRDIRAMGEVIQQSTNLHQFTKAKTEIVKRMSEINARATSPDADFSTQKGFNNVIKESRQELEKTKGEVLSGVTDINTRLKLSGSFDLSALSMMNNNKKIGRQRLNAAMKNDLLNNVNTLTQQYIGTVPENKGAIREEIVESINNHIELGVINENQGRKFLADTLESLPILDAENQISQDPLRARGMLARREFGITDETQREKLFKQAETIMKRNEKEARVQLARDSHKLKQRVFKDIIDNKVTLSNIDDLFAEGRMTLEEADVAKSLIVSDKKVDPIDVVKTAKKISDFFDTLGFDEEDQTVEVGLEKTARYRIMVIKAYKDGHMSKAKALAKLAEIDNAYDAEVRKSEFFKAQYKNGKEVKGWWRQAFTIGEKGLSEEEQEKAAVFISDKLTEALLKGGIPQGKVQEFTKNMFEEYVRTNHRELLSLPEITSGTMDQKEGLKTITTHPDKNVPERIVTTKPNTVAVTSPDGQTGTVPEDKLEDALKAGFTLTIQPTPEVFQVGGIELE